jgi:hypothetical protein
MPSC